MTAEIICVGTEILLGNIVNTNAAYLSERLAALGISVFFETTVGDNPERVEEVIRTGMKRSDILILSGGLGPTKDADRNLWKMQRRRSGSLPTLRASNAR